MFDLLRSFFLLLNAIKMYPRLLSDKEGDILMRRIEPFHRKHLLILHLDLHLQLRRRKMKEQLPLSRKKQ